VQKKVAAITHFTYLHCLKPILFSLDPEVVHHLLVNTGRNLGKATVAKKLITWAWSYQDPKLMKKIDGITFLNPVGLAAGFDYDANLIETLPAMGFGFHTIGTVTLEPCLGNPPPQLARFSKSRALLVNKGLKNIGARAIIKKLQPLIMTIPTGISIASTNKHFATEAAQISEIMTCFSLFENSGLHHAYYELNISCPNTFGGEPFTTPTKLERLVTELDGLKLSHPVYVKMPIDQSPGMTKKLLETLAAHNIQGVIFGNLTKDKSNPDLHAGDVDQWQKLKGNVSGKPTWTRSNACIQLTKSEFGSRFTIIGTGGIFTGKDAAQKMALGANLVQLITGMIYEGPQLIGQINSYLDKSKVSNACLIKNN